MDRCEYNRADMAPELVSDNSGPGMSEVSRIAGVFLEPGKAFRDIAERPAWIAPLVLIIVFGLAYMFAFNQHVGWERFMRQTIENSPRTAQLTPEQREQAISMQTRFAPIMGFVGVAAGVPISLLAAAGVLLLVFNSLMGAQVKFKQVFGVVTYANLPGVLFTALATGVIFLKNPDDFNLRNPLVFNPGAFMDPTGGSKFVYSLATSLDLFTLWTIVLVAIGMSAAGRKLSFGSALMGVLLPWAGWVLVKAAMAGLFS